MFEAILITALTIGLFVLIKVRIDQHNDNLKR
jgi:hypothetical protein